MADPGPSTSQANRSTSQQQRPQQPQQQQQQQQEAKQNAGKRWLSMNRKKGNKKGPRKAEDTEEQPNALLESLLQTLRTCPEGKELQALISALQPSARDIEMELNSVKDDLLLVLPISYDYTSIYEFGSIKSGLLFRDSDLDFYIHFRQGRKEREEQIRLIHIVCANMTRKGTFKDIIKILRAKMPLLQAVHVRTNRRCDINFSNDRGWYNSMFLRAVMRFDPRIYQLAMIIKFWARRAHIFTVQKQMNSYGLLMMMIFFLQTLDLPVLSSVENMQRDIPRDPYGAWNLAYPMQIRYKTCNVSTVRELLVSFFKFYAEFDFSKNLISPFTGRLCSLRALKEKTIPEQAAYYRAVEREDYPEISCGPFVTIQDPFELNLNVGKLMRMKRLYEQLSLSFRHAYAMCLAQQYNTFSKLLISLYTDTKRHQKPKRKTKNKTHPHPLALHPFSTVGTGNCIVDAFLNLSTDTKLFITYVFGNSCTANNPL
ncbi:terminal uridylyltransferase Tailor-like [Anopheles ziemanni]|uniref:terminal uridylyltransferase Tailor-like n=1 Tax=Anopheles ziemanni TaxID=345580 RepID=UPI00266045D3|nr:terminal uridylyltransferase Tailor-like [Anopheles ziemanni]